MIIRRYFSVLFIFTLFLQADILKENFITFDLNGSSPSVLVDFESDNLEKFMSLDDNDNGIISWKELKAHKEKIEKLVLPHIHILSDNKQCQKQVKSFEVYRRVHQSYIKLDLFLSCPIPKDEISINYDLFFDVDKAQKAFVKLKEQKSKPIILSARKQSVTIKLENHSLWQAFKNFFIEGVWHIWMGYDHILFLLMLLIPSVYIYKDKRFYPRGSFKEIFIEVLKIVTGFSIAHSLTLGLSVSEIVVLDSRFVEVAIALSILFTAINNLYPMITKHTWMMAFGFGLIHGFGFANVLHDLLIKDSKDFLAMLFGFNLGVEAGQMVIVTAVLPVLFILEKTVFYKRFVLYGFSAFAAIIATLWAIQRAFGLSLIPF